MFSFIKYIQELMAKFKRNKGLWFTTISVVSILGISLSMYVLLTMTSNVSKEVYKSMSDTYHLDIENKIDKKEDSFKKILLAITQDNNLLGNIEKNNEIFITEYVKSFNDRLAKNRFRNIGFSAYSAANKNQIFRNSINSVMSSKNPLYGIEVLPDGVFFVYLQPLLKGDNILGVLELRESIHTLKVDFEDRNSGYVFLLDKKMFNNLSLKAKNGKYKDIIDNFAMKQAEYDTKFPISMLEMSEEDVKEFFDMAYFVDETYYRTYKTVTDINGADIGIFVVGETIENTSGFVNIADNMTKTVTSVALGLVISIILFMF